MSSSAESAAATVVHPILKETPAKELTDGQLADEYAITRLRNNGWKPNANPYAARLGELAKELLARQTGKPADQQQIVEGETYKVPITQQENRSHINDQVGLFKRLRRLFTTDKLIAEGTYTITLGDVRKKLGEEAAAAFITTERIGPRSIGEPVLKEVTKVA